MEKIKKSFSINLEKLFQMIILLLLFNYLAGLINSRYLSLYIHPRMNFLIYSSLYIIILFIFFPITKISSKVKSSFFKSKYLAFLLLLFFFYFIPKDFIQSDIANLRGVKVGNNTNIFKNDEASNSFDDSIKVDVSVNESNFIGIVNTMYNHTPDYINKSILIKGYIVKAKGLPKDQFLVLQFALDNSVLGLLCSYKKSDIAKLKNNQQVELLGTIYSDFTKYLKGEKIPIIKVNNYNIISDPEAQNVSVGENSNSNSNVVINESNYLKTIDSIYNNQDDFNSANITITGFIFRANDFSTDQFIVGRMVIFCCAADASVYGLLCSTRDQNILSLKDRQWVELQGTIHSDSTKFSEGKKIPMIQVNNVKLIDAPKDQYVY